MTYKLIAGDRAPGGIAVYTNQMNNMFTVVGDRSGVSFGAIEPSLIRDEEAIDVTGESLAQVALAIVSISRTDDRTVDLVKNGRHEIEELCGALEGLMGTLNMEHAGRPVYDAYERAWKVLAKIRGNG